jgi:3-methylcrotonyl-CoA carboxylase alpha subunit
MIAKLIVWGEDRAQALKRLDVALAQTHIVGLQTNVAFLRRCAASDSFAKADLDTALIERERAVLFGQPPLALPCAAAGAVAHTLAAERSSETADPWSRTDGWRIHGGATRRFDIEYQDAHHAVVLERHHDGRMFLGAGGNERQPFEARARGNDRHDVMLGSQRWLLSVYALGESVSVFAPEGSATVTEVDVLAHAGEGGEGGRLTAPMPGKVIALLVKPGEAVKRGQPLAVMEAMKMEHTLAAPADGVVKELRYSVGDQVAEGDALLDFEAGAQAA